MEKEEFKSLWKIKFPEAYPIGNELKWIYEKRWFRIHSLPDSKRYAETEKEYEIILKRQNEIIDDLIGDDEVILLYGLYRDDRSNSNYAKIAEFKDFQKADTIELHKIRPKENENELYLDIYVKHINWKSNERNEILRAIADDEIRMMIIYPKKNRIISPYDGGVDLILESEDVKNNYEEKCQKWSSKHPKGL